MLSTPLSFNVEGNGVVMALWQRRIRCVTVPKLAFAAYAKRYLRLLKLVPLAYVARANASILSLCAPAVKT